MYNRFIILSLLILCFSPLFAEHITLRNGKHLYGTVLHDTEEVIIFQTTDGQRFQLLRTDIVSIDEDTDLTAQVTDERESDGSRPVAIRISASGGMASVTEENIGGMANAEFQLGSRHINGYPIFLGGSIGYSGAFLSTAAHFVPLQVVLSLPLPLLKSQANGAELGVSLGYGFGVANTKGGMTGSLNIGYRHYLTEQTSVIIGGVAQFQQTTRIITETIESQTYTNESGRALWLIGAKLTLQI